MWMSTPSGLVCRGLTSLSLRGKRNDRIGQFGHYRVRDVFTVLHERHASSLIVIIQPDRVPGANLIGRDEVGEALHKMAFDGALQIPGAIPHIRPFRKQEIPSFGTTRKQERALAGRQDPLAEHCGSHEPLIGPVWPRGPQPARVQVLVGGRLRWFDRSPVRGDLLLLNLEDVGFERNPARVEQLPLTFT